MSHDSNFLIYFSRPIRTRLQNSPNSSCHYAHGHRELRPSLPVASGGGASAPMNFKTRLCKSFSTLGICPNGFNCGFAHGSGELRQANSSTRGSAGKLNLVKTVLCKNWQETGKCSYGDRCNFAHGENELVNAEAANEKVG